MKTTILIPILNYEQTLERVLEKIKGLCDEILILCDITKLDKEQEIKEWLSVLDKKYGLHVVYRINQRGYGSAIRLGFEKASGDVVIVMHADECDEPRVIPKMIEKIRLGADIVCGTRFSKGGGIVGNILKERIAKSISLALHFLSKTGTFDATNGFRTYRTKAVRSLKTNANSFAFNIEVIVKAVEKGLVVEEVPTIWYNRMVGKPNFRVKKEGKEYAKWTLYAILKKPSKFTFLIYALILFALAVFRFT